MCGVSQGTLVRDLLSGVWRLCPCHPDTRATLRRSPEAGQAWLVAQAEAVHRRLQQHHLGGLLTQIVGRPQRLSFRRAAVAPEKDPFYPGRGRCSYSQRRELQENWPGAVFTPLDTS